ncbi:hypothetical protein NCCP691_01810 [Noviherbaspirillum aridicola]|uniref:Anti-sigma factor NepR domain-containing protein n=1 Tax=Noviherbaspirillum aridicola TaxID=2849687 RepID=A0ABQ4PZI8_9BURK|nr:hypothetical protein NCCP691_01810 [Noviherbaspirillum aridicola]
MGRAAMTARTAPIARIQSIPSLYARPPTTAPFPREQQKPSHAAVPRPAVHAEGKRIHRQLKARGTRLMDDEDYRCLVELLARLKTNLES